MKQEWLFLEKKMEALNYYINNEVLEYIANNVKSNIRELEGAFNQIINISSSIAFELFSANCLKIAIRVS